MPMRPGPRVTTTQTTAISRSSWGPGIQNMNGARPPESDHDSLAERRPGAKDELPPAGRDPSASAR